MGGVGVVGFAVLVLVGFALVLLSPRGSAPTLLERLTLRRSFGSAEELFAATRELITTLERQGHAASAAELRAGMGCLNGLTDGWALFLESIERVRAGEAKRFDPAARMALEKIRADVRFAVYRR